MKSVVPSSSRGAFAEIARLQKEGRRSVLATLLFSAGSVPLSLQSKLVLRDDGSIMGTVGGGALEARVLVAAREAIGGEEARVLDFELSQSEAVEGGMICGGRCTLLVEPVAPGREADVFAAIARAEAAGEPVVVITLLSPETRPSKLALTDGGRLLGEVDPSIASALREGAERALAAERPEVVEAPVKAHFDPLLPRPTAYIFGGGHVALPVAHLADLVGFRVVVIDDRAEFADRERFPRADQVVVTPVAEAFRRLGVGEDGYVVTITRGHAMDEEVAAEALRTPARYIGMIGSKRKVAAVLERLRKRGFSESDLARIHAPIGIDIHSETVEEIAVSIVAEMIAVRRVAPSSSPAARRRGWRRPTPA